METPINLPNEEEIGLKTIPKRDRNKLYAVIFIVFAMVGVYVSILIHQLAIAFFIIIPILYLSRREIQEYSFKLQIAKSLIGFLRLIQILTLIAVFVFISKNVGFIITTLIFFVGFKLWNYYSHKRIRKDQENQIFNFK